MSKIALSGNPSGTGTFTIASPNSNTDRTLTLPDNSGTVITSGSTTGINAEALSTGTVPTARLGSGTANNTTFLRGDQTWQTINVTPTTDQVLTATAGAEVGAVGTYAFLHLNATNITVSAGGTRAGSGLVYASIFPWTAGGTSTALGQAGTGIPSGTWRCMGQITAESNTNYRGATLWLRIS